MNRIKTRPASHKVTASPRAVRSRSERLESRLLFHLEVTAPLADLSVPAGVPFHTIDLPAHFDNELITGSVVALRTNVGDINLELFDTLKPLSVTNFLGYVNRGDYNGTFFHRTQVAATDGIGVIQGGGFRYPGFGSIVDGTTPTVPNEFTTNGVIPNTRGTISYAKSSDPDSATSQFFINTSSNPALDNPSNSGGFTVFGKTLGNTIAVADAVNALPRFQFASPFAELPLRNYTSTDFQNNTTPDQNHLVLVTSAAVVPKISFTVTSSDPALVAAAVDAAGALTLNRGEDRAGAVDITVTATDAAGATVSDVFTVNVTSSALSVDIGGTGARAVTFTDADGTAVSVVVRGATASVRFAGTDLTRVDTAKGVTVNGTAVAIESIVVSGGGGAGALSVTSKGGDGEVRVGSISADAPLRSVSGRGTVLTGGMAVNGAVTKVDLLRAEGGVIALGGAGSTSFRARNVTNTQINAPGIHLTSLKADTFASSDGSHGIVAASAGQVAVRGNYSGSLTFTGGVSSLSVGGDMAGTLRADAARSVRVKGSLHDSRIDLLNAGPAASSALGKLAVGGAMARVTLRTAGGAGTISAGSIVDSNIFVGFGELPVTPVLPQAATDFVVPAALKSVVVKSSPAGPSFARSNVAAWDVGRLSLGVIETVDGGPPFGVAANRIGALQGTVAGKRIKLARLDDPTAAAQEIAALGGLANFTIRVV